jgi:prepilin-type N-terminal cleavage/methylation domain-containing protein
MMHGAIQDPRPEIRGPRPAFRVSRSAFGRSAGRRSFTLVELLVALAILSAAVAIAWGALSVSLTAWRRGDDLLADLRRGEYAADDLAALLRSAFFRPSPDGRYGWRLETQDGDPPSDRLRWTALGGPGADTPPGEPGVPRRLTFAIEEGEDGIPAATLRAGLSFEDAEDEEPDPVVRVWPDIRGFACRVWNPTNETWEAEWEDTNSIPVAVEIALYPAGPSEAPETVLSRRVDLPLAGALSEMVAEQRRPAGRASEPAVRGGAVRLQPGPPGRTR